MGQRYTPLSVSGLLGGMSRADFQRLCQRWVPISVAAEQVLVKPFQPGQFIYLLNRGRVVLYQMRNGERQVVQTLGAGALFGQMRILGAEMPDCFAATAEPSELLLLSRAAVEQLIRQRPQVALAVLRQAGPQLMARETAG